MANFNYSSMWDDLVKSNINFSTDTFKMMLLGSGYVPDKHAHTKLSDVNSFEVTGTGYTAGGTSLTVTLTKDTILDRETIDFNLSTAHQVSWPSTTVTDVYSAVIYKSRGGAASSDELVHYIDMGGPKSAGGGSFIVTINTPIIIDNS